MRIAVIGSGISGLSAAWLLSKYHTVDIIEKDNRLGGHANTQSVQINGNPINVDTGFIVYNEATYPNLTALFDHLDVETAATDMSFAVSARNESQEYSGSGLSSIFARRSNLINPTFLRMLYEIFRFYKHARSDASLPQFQNHTLGQYLSEKRYSKAFQQDHLLPMGAAIWSVPSSQMLDFPFCSFIGFCDNHGLLQIRNRPQWRTVVGGSRQYISRMKAAISGDIMLNATIDGILRKLGSVTIQFRNGQDRKYDHIILACHSDQALHLLETGEQSPTENERNILSRIRYQKNVAILHQDETLMPKCRKVWSAWNYLSEEKNADSSLCVSYWMNALQPLATSEDLFVTINPIRHPKEGKIFRSYMYAHPIFDQEAEQAKKQIWSLQGCKRTWFCGAYMGHGFHEDGLQAGLAVAEQLAGIERPWKLNNPSNRLHIPLAEQMAKKEAAQ